MRELIERKKKIVTKRTSTKYLWGKQRLTDSKGGWSMTRIVKEPNHKSNENSDF
jgi:hypothetical protein